MARKRNLLVLAGAGVILACFLGWLLTVGPVGTRSDAHYNNQARVEYSGWLEAHGRSARVRSCEPLRTALEVYGRPSYYSCMVDSGRRCVSIGGGGATDF